MTESPTTKEIRDITPPFAGLAGLTIFVWIILGFLQRYDEKRYYFTIAMFLSGTIAAFQLRHARKNKNPLEGSAVVAFIIIWLAIFTFTPDGAEVVFNEYSLLLRQLELLALLPIAIVWVPPFSEESFFGIVDLDRNDRLHAVWRSSVLMLILINLINTGDEWYWRSLEFIILIPMIYETTQLHKGKKDDLPVLTLFIQTEMSQKFAVPFSMFKSVFFIMVAFLFEILASRLWLIVILGYFGAGFLYGIVTLIPEEMRSDDASSEEFGDKMREMFGSEKKSRRKRRRKGKSKPDKVIQEIEASLGLNDDKISTTPTSLTKVVDSNKQLSTELGSGTIQEKAHAMGKRVRTGIEKPYYTLNHILSTLNEEDFSQAWRVNKSGLSLPSTRGNWSPPKGLILFPVELEKYDFRRADEILLLGFNQPFERKEGSVKFEFGGDSKKNARITDNSIKFGDVEFNTRSLIVTKDQWSQIIPKLEIVTQDDDISYTGFKTLTQMQETLVKLSDKWMEVRFTAQEAAVNFLAGLLGSSNPIFVPRDGLQAPSYPELEGKIADGTLEVEDD